MFQTKVSVFEKPVIFDHPIFLSVQALKLRQGQLHFLKWNHVRFSFSFTELEANQQSLQILLLKVNTRRKIVGETLLDF